MVADVFREQLRLGRERRREENRERGRREERARWQAWLARMEAAEREDRPFDEPPPGGELRPNRRVVPRRRTGIGDRPLQCL